MDWNEILMTIITTVIIPAVIVLGNVAYKAIQENVKDKNIQKYLLIAADCVSDAVAAVAQTFIDKLCDADWNEQTKKEAFNIAKTKALEHLGLTGQKLLKEALGDFDSWISTKVEAEVKRLAVKSIGYDS